MLLFVLQQGLRATLPWASSILIDVVLPRHNVRLLCLIVSGLAAIGVARAGIGYARDGALLRLRAAADRTIRERLHRILLFSDLQGVTSRGEGFWLSRLANDVGDVAQAVTTDLTGYIEKALLFLMGVVLVLATSSRLALAVAPFLAVMLAASAAGSKARGRESRLWREAWGGYVERLSEDIRLARPIRELTVEGGRESEARAVIDQAVSKRLAGSQGLLRLQSWVGALGGFAPVAVLGLGLYFVMEGYLTLGKFVAFNAYLAYLTGPFQQLTTAVQRLRIVAAAARRLDDVRCLETCSVSPPPCAGELLPLACAPSFELRSVSYSWGRGSMALKDVRLLIPGGAHVAIVGLNGSGKSTLLAILTTLLAPTEGELLISGIPVTDLGGRQIRQGFAMLSGLAPLFRGTVVENVRMAAPGTSREYVEAIFAELGAFELSSLTPADLDRPVSELAGRISDGERQLIGFARLLARRAYVAFIDEGFRPMSEDLRFRIMAKVRERYRKNTLLLATHDPRLCTDFDQVVVLRKGRIAAMGTPLEVHSWLQQLSEGSGFERPAGPIARVAQP
ncbi:MAG: ATP-binding cassette domain-containing protein [Planctomycetes bacterium]|nr:ATP-binding cassette domain-containing protein [Planctomycetota bacterium]